MEAWLSSLLHTLALPEVGLSTVFVVSLISATLLPLGSEPAVFGLVKLNPDLFWAAIAVATAGNTLGGAIDWWMGYGAHTALNRFRKQANDAYHTRALQWLHRLGPKACLLSWLPGIGDPLCAVAGWLKLPFWPCLAYMAI
ncbi:MAG: DedA family protein, partial [Betaproteobacteria bacterium]|nr:DedA family protein [Betaproteobacteria bacterium]